jgi:hypothetical protein
VSGHFTNTFSFVGGTVRLADLAYIGMCGDDMAKSKVAHTYFSEWDNGVWRNGGKVDWPTVGMCVARQPLQQMCALGMWGALLLLGSGDRHVEQIGGSVEAIKARGPLRGVRSIGEQVVAVGMGRQVWRRDASGAWAAIDQGARPAEGEREVVGFEAVDGFSDSDMYAVGWSGEIWHYDGARWSREASPTTAVLTGVLCGGDGTVYACGRKGLLLARRAGVWSVIEHASMIDDLWHLAWYRDTLYLASMDGLFTLAGERLLALQFGDDAPSSCYHLAVGDGVLWSVGAKDIMAFDGAAWRRID